MPTPAIPTPAIEPARAGDLEALIAILAEDELGGHGDALTPETAPAYRGALAAILADPNALLLVSRGESGTPLGLAHASVFQGLSDEGARVVTLHSLFMARAARGQGLGAHLLAHVEIWARTQGARFVTLVSNKKRGDAHRFYQVQGYEQRHEGFKKRL